MCDEQIGPMVTGILFLLSKSIRNEKYALAHELGHARWSLRHPSGDPTKSDWGLDEKYDDIRNIMHNNAEEMKDPCLRGYQRKKCGF